MSIVETMPTHKHPTVIDWLEKTSAGCLHFTPDIRLLVNAIEGFFAKSPKKNVSKSRAYSIPTELKNAIPPPRFSTTQRKPKTFVWTK